MVESFVCTVTITCSNILLLQPEGSKVTAIQCQFFWPCLLHVHAVFHNVENFSESVLVNDYRGCHFTNEPVYLWDVEAGVSEHYTSLSVFCCQSECIFTKNNSFLTLNIFWLGAAVVSSVTSRAFLLHVLPRVCMGSLQLLRLRTTVQRHAHCLYVHCDELITCPKSAGLQTPVTLMCISSYK